MSGIIWKGDENLRPVKKENFAQKADFYISVFWLKLFFGALFTKINFTFLKLACKDRFFYTQFA
jgi:hypothetical protein